MKSLMGLIGLLLLLGGVAVMVYAGTRAYDLHKAGLFSLDVMDGAFWLKNPDDFLSGIAPNGRWLLTGTGGLILFLLGRHVQNVSAPLMRE
mgnify:CR=1 FL=1